MTLYRIVHKSIVQLLEEQPLVGCAFHEKLPFIRAYDTVAMAVLMHPVGMILPDLPDNFRILTYECPEESVVQIEESLNCLYVDPTAGRPKFGNWVIRFLEDDENIVARVPSIRWKWGSVYVMNPRHADFNRVCIRGIYSIQSR